MCACCNQSVANGSFVSQHIKFSFGMQWYASCHSTPDRIAQKSKDRIGTEYVAVRRMGLHLTYINGLNTLEH